MPEATTNVQVGTSLNTEIGAKIHQSSPHIKKRKLNRKADSTTTASTLLVGKKKNRIVGEAKRGGHGKEEIKRRKNATFGKRPKKLQQPSCEIAKDDNTNDNDDNFRKAKRMRKRKRRIRTGKGNGAKIEELDEASRLQRRTRYLLIKMKLEQNLIDAYCAEGWKGQSREKIKPERELQRANKQILKCKLGIREAIRQLDLLGSVGCIDGSAVAPDGSVYHEHIVCAQCKLREAFPDNDIILCDGTCNSAFHQKCLDPPLSTENIPPGDEGWFCKFCRSKMEIIEATNAHLGTHFSMSSDWQDIFKEEAALAESGSSLLHPELEWPSDDSEDDDYDPERFENTCTSSGPISVSYTSHDGSSPSSLGSLEDEVFSLSGEISGNRCRISHHQSTIDSDDTTDYEVLCGPRQRTAVDYIKLNDELFGKNAPANDQISEDEDWGPAKKKPRHREPEATSLDGIEKSCQEARAVEAKPELSSRKSKRPCFRIPPNALEKLRIVFSENELPPRAVKENLSEQLGLELEKVNKWFKNARYLALKARKSDGAKSEHITSLVTDESAETEKDKADEGRASVHAAKISNKLKRYRSRETSHDPTSDLMLKQQKKASPQKPANCKVDLDFSDDVSLKLLREKAKREKRKTNPKSKVVVPEAEAEMERLCLIEDKVAKLRQVLQGIASCTTSKHKYTISCELEVEYVPVAEVIEKRIF